MTETKYLEYIFHLSKKFKQRETTQPLPKKSKGSQCTRTLTLKGKILIFKTPGISKIVYLFLIETVLISILEGIWKIRKTFLCCSSKPKINHETLCSTFEDGRLKNIDVKSKVISLQWFCVKKLHDSNHHGWKIIPLYFIKKYFRKNFLFQLNLFFNLALV